jgi:hypothetical protein
MAIRMMTSLVPKRDGRTARVPPKQVEPFYQSAPYLAWREYVITRAGRRCEAIDDNHRCDKAEPHHRLFADHITERRDGGSDLDPTNGQCLCAKHHAIKTSRARAARAADRGFKSSSRSTL